MLLSQSPAVLFVPGFVLGGILGSFALCAGERLARSQSLLDPPSSCDVCGHRLAAWQLLPLAGFVLLKGRCAFCHSPIGWSKPLLELAFGLFLGCVAWQAGLSLQLAFWALAGTWLLMLAVMDAASRRLPDVLLLPLCLLVALAGLVPDLAPNPGFGAALAWGLAGSLFLLGFGLLGKWRTGRTVLGLGDVKLAFCLGALVHEALPLLLCLAALLALAWARCRPFRTAPSNSPDTLPFAPFLVAATGCVGLAQLGQLPVSLSRILC